MRSCHLSVFGLAGGLRWRAQGAQNQKVEVCALARPETAAHRANKLDSDKFDDEAGDQTGSLIESCISLRFSITHFNALCNMTN